MIEDFKYYLSVISHFSTGKCIHVCTTYYGENTLNNNISSELAMIKRTQFNHILCIMLLCPKVVWCFRFAGGLMDNFMRT